MNRGGRSGFRRLRPLRRGSFRPLSLLLAVPLGAFLLFSFVTWVRERLTVPAFSATRVADPIVAVGHGRAVPNPVKATSDGSSLLVMPRRGERPRRIVLILDDVGFEHQLLESATGIDPNVSFAVIPGESQSADSARLLAAKGFEILCHLPMEPEGFPHVSPGDRAILGTMPDEEIRAQVAEDFGLVPQARGFNNHMGSRSTADRRVMEQVFAAVPAGTFFVDSRTSPRSIAGVVARERKIKTASRDVFLDSAIDERSIRARLAELAALAERRGLAVGIGHMYPSTIRVLLREVPRLRERGFQVVRASEAVQ